MISRSTIFAAAVSVAAIAFASSAGATALSGSMTADYLYPDSGTVYSTTTLTVGTPISCPGADPICSPFAAAATISASGLSISVLEDAGSSYTGASFNGIGFSGITFDDGSVIVGFTLDTDLPGLTSANIAFTSDSISYNAQGLDFSNAGYHITLNLLTRRVSDVPEPLTLSLFGAGLAGAAAMRRVKKKAA